MTYQTKIMKTDISILDNDPATCAKMLDDNSLGKMISTCAQTLCNIHFLVRHYLQGQASWAFGRMEGDAPLPPKHDHDEWSLWGKNCLANYNELLKYVLACCDEWIFRNNPDATYLQGSIEDPRQEKIVIMQGLTIKKHKHHDVIEWCSQNLPDLPKINCEQCMFLRQVCNCEPSMPLVMDEKYKHNNLETVLDAIDGSDLNTIAAYRNYYCSRVQEAARKKCENCNGEGSYLIEYEINQKAYPANCDMCNGEGYFTQVLTWTRRQKPEWLANNIISKVININIPTLGE
jgi:hypothetical protein